MLKSEVIILEKKHGYIGVYLIDTLLVHTEYMHTYTLLKKQKRRSTFGFSNQTFELVSVRINWSRPFFFLPFSLSPFCPSLSLLLALFSSKTLRPITLDVWTHA
jgi:hypothetical protein